MDKKLQEIIRSSSFEIKEGLYIYAKVNSLPKDSIYFMASCDDTEITIVTKQENELSLDLIEKNKDLYVLIKLSVSVPFYAVGFIAAVTNAIASKGANILVVATYSYDYIMVRQEHKSIAHQSLLGLGFKEI